MLLLLIDSCAIFLLETKFIINKLIFVMHFKGGWELAFGYSSHRVSRSTGSAVAAVRTLSPQADVAQAQAVLVNISVACGLQNILRTNLGPKGTMKLLVSGAGDIRLTNHSVLLHDMQIQHPTASLIVKVATAQHDNWAGIPNLWTMDQHRSRPVRNWANSRRRNVMKGKRMAKSAVFPRSSFSRQASCMLCFKTRPVWLSRWLSRY
ncbi:hypothetical protein HJG60_009811 [Phyllostomus discolor]|uniref:Uncharacterized protein n=1 Tax=Phyllostomus discolor TaxID=89673 RepID=A0A834B8K5_9CHIR|nr:hypothetical protein HJG60_009811 [Phyllostomus discolor]